jgi:hypothetical protein
MAIGANVYLAAVQVGVTERPPQGDPFVVYVKSPDAALAEANVHRTERSEVLLELDIWNVFQVMAKGVVNVMVVVPVTVQPPPLTLNASAMLVMPFAPTAKEIGLPCEVVPNQLPM